MKASKKLLVLVLLAWSATLPAQQQNDDPDFAPPGTHAPDPSLHLDPNPQPQNGNGTLGQIYNLSKCGLNFVQATQRLGKRLPQPGVNQPATYSISGLPACFVVEKAYIWSSMSGTQTAFNVTVTNPLGNTSAYPAVCIGTGQDKCWGYGGTSSYRVDVTASISGNGNYTISGFPTNPPTPQKDTDGATLFIIYSDPNATYQGHMIIHDGCLVGIGGNTAQTLTGINACANSTFGRAFCMTGDWQLNGISGTWNGSNINIPWNWWNFDQVATNVTAGQATALYQHFGSNDCYNWVVMGLYYQTTTCISCPNGALTTTTSNTPATCSQCNGSATVTVTSGNPPFTYLWSPSNQTTSTATGLCPGNYTVTVTSGCLSSTVVVTVPNTSSALTVNQTHTNVLCNGQCNGTANITVTGGTAPYTYAWTPSGNGPNPTNLCAGNYTVTVTDASGCTGSVTFTVTQPAVLNGVMSIPINATCNNVCNGSLAVTPSGGTAPYSYSWAPAGGNGPSATGLCPGTYTVTITDANGCTRTVTATITQPPPLVVPTSAVAASCNLANGSATVTPSGGTPNYTYMWLPGNQTTATATGLLPGNYTVTVTDANGCTATAVATVGNQAGPQASINNSTMVLCFGNATGSATVTVTGGNSPYSYVWSPSGGNAATATGLTAGNYTVLVTDANNCTATASVTITQPPQLTLNTAGFSALCNGACNGQGVSIVQGGVGPFTYNWTPNGGNGPNATGLCAGTYTCLVTDANGCTISDTAIVSQPPPLILSTTFDTSHCGQPDGQACVNVSGGVGPYSYLWNPTSQVGNCATGLTPGNYCVTVTDANGCTSTACVTVPNAAGVVASISGSTNVSCFNLCDGTATSVATGGIGPYTYSWAPSGGNNATATGLCAGVYTITITDATLCTSTATVTITQPAQLIITPGPAQTICIGQSVTLTATTTGGTNPVTITWSPNGPTVSPTTTTTYTITATDANGCTATQQTITVTVNPPLNVTGMPGPIICVGASVPLTAQASGGSGTGYSYVWAPGGGLSCTTCQNPTASPTTTTIYTVTVNDNCGTPVDTAQVVVTVMPLPAIAFSTPNPDGCAPFCTTFTNNTPNSASCSWTFTGGTPSSSNNCSPGQVCYPIPGSYSVTLTVTDNNGCINTQTIPNMITVHPNPVAGFDLTPDSVSILNPEICITNTSLNADTSYWDFGDPSDVNNFQSTIGGSSPPCHSYQDTGTFCVKQTVVTQYGCRDSITYCLVVTPDFTFYVPNAFTPDEDGNNDLFFPKGEGIDENKFEMWIFDRWGNLIWYTQRWGFGWDGKANGGSQIAQEDVYVWKIKLYDRAGMKHSYVGHVSLIR